MCWHQYCLVNCSVQKTDDKQFQTYALKLTQFKDCIKRVSAMYKLFLAQKKHAKTFVHDHQHYTMISVHTHNTHTHTDLEQQNKNHTKTTILKDII